MRARFIAGLRYSSSITFIVPYVLVLCTLVVALVLPPPRFIYYLGLCSTFGFYQFLLVGSLLLLILLFPLLLRECHYRCCALVYSPFIR